MKKGYVLIIWLVICLNTILVCVNIALIVLKTVPKDEPQLEPLFLTQYLRPNETIDAQKLSQVYHDKFLNVDSYSGYLTVNETTDSHMFFWYFPAEKWSSTVPLVLWLNGGPGSSSMYGLFAEVGPFIPISATDLKLREYSWHKTYNLLFIDNPVGTGFSLTEDGYVRSQLEVGRDLLNAMQQFFKLFPDLRSNDFYISGESYAGKYITSFAHAIHVNNINVDLDLKERINLKGFMIGNGLIDPIHQIGYADYLYQHGLIDEFQADILRTAQNKFVDLMQKEHYKNATQLWSDMRFSSRQYTPNGSLIENFTGFTSFFNYLRADGKDLIKSYMTDFLNQRSVRLALHVGNIEFHASSKKVKKHLYKDYVHSVAPWLSELLLHYKVLIFTGQLDLRNPYPLVHNVIINLNYSGINEEYKETPRRKWYVDGELAGYYKIAGNLTEGLVRNAGHSVPLDQPKWSFYLIDRFVNNVSLN